MKGVSIEDVPFGEIDAVVLDLDGTLYGSKHFVLRVIMGELAHLPVLVSERLTRRFIAGKFFPSGEAFCDAFFGTMAKYLPVSKQYVRNWYYGHYMPLQVKILTNHYHAEEWALRLIAECKKRHIALAVLSDYAHVPEKIKALGYDPDSFDVVVTGAELGGLKPAGGAMAEVIRRLGATPDRALVIGDKRRADGGAAAAVGAKFRLVNKKN